MPAHTVDHIRCPACQARSVAGKNALQPSMPFADAFAEFMNLRTGVSERSDGKVKRWSPATIERYQEYGDRFALLYGRVPLYEFTDGHLVEYAEMRAGTAGQNTVRKETDMVIRVLRDAGLPWAEEDPLFKAYERLRLPFVESDDQRAIDRNQILMLMRLLGEKPEDSQWVLYDTVVALYTCTSTNERRLATIDRVMRDKKLFEVGPRQSKNKYRHRWIPLETEEVLFAFDWLLNRAAECGATEPHHFLYPWRGKRGEWDPTRPMTRWCLSQQFEGLGEKIGADGFTPYAIRHAAMTILAEAGTPIDVILSFGGQVSEKMRKHYTTISLMAKRETQPVAWAGFRLLGEQRPLPPKKPSAKVLMMPSRSLSA